MTDPDKAAFETQSRNVAADHSAYAVVLPCAPDEFSDFISGLLGKAQTIEQMFVGAFEVNTADIENTFHLVDQRIRQQNEASLVQFTIRIVYSDDSSVLLNSLDDFLHYSEIKPLVSVAAHLSWTYLIKFQDKRFPEKQQIDLSIITDLHSGLVRMEGGGHVINRISMFGHSPSYLALRISHTARTWGVDVESLLSGHIKSWLISDNRLKKCISKYSGKVGFGFGLSFFALSMFGAYLTASRFVARQAAIAKAILEPHSGGATGIAGKVDFLVQAAARGIWPRFALGLSGFFIFSSVLAVLFGAWVTTSAENPVPSFLLLSKKAKERKVVVLEKQKRSWLNFLASSVTSILLRPANYSDSDPGPKTCPNVIVQKFDLSLYCAELNNKFGFQLYLR